MLRRPLPLLLGSLAVAGLVSCSGTGGGDDWSGGLPTGEPAVVTMENLSYSPPRVLGLVSDDHPAAKQQESAIRRSGIKRIPPSRMERLLEVLDSEGFVAASAPLNEFTPADPKTTLRRLTISIGGHRRAFTLPRGPAKPAADRFNQQALAVQAMFNEVVDFRQEVGYRDPEYFYAVARALFDPAMHESGKPADAPRDGKQ